MCDDIPRRGIKEPRSAVELGGRLRVIASSQPDPSEVEADVEFPDIHGAVRRFFGPPRVTLRSLLLFVGLIAVILGGMTELLRQRANDVIAYHRREEQRLLRIALECESKAAAAYWRTEHR